MKYSLRPGKSCGEIRFQGKIYASIGLTQSLQKNLPQERRLAAIRAVAALLQCCARTSLTVNSESIIKN
jgi:hypothetical protein